MPILDMVMDQYNYLITNARSWIELDVFSELTVSFWNKC